MNYFRYKQFNKDVITVAVGYYLRYTLSYRDISEILRERGVNVHHSTVYRWVQEYAPILYQIWNKFNFATEPKIISSIYFYMNPVTQ
ncbi:transposase for insertion sequence-like element IS431mec [Staphylococcus aureus H31276]|nr:transposase for insertion sequence-like element IS431mec [Staphylococcus aureus H31276]EVZ75055.1 transposase for insertion sequence-like element IS431mec [Staphylococcus aureus H31276]